MVQRDICPGAVQRTDPHGAGKGKRVTQGSTGFIPLEKGNSMSDDGEGNLYCKEIFTDGIFKGKIRTLTSVLTH